MATQIDVSDRTARVRHPLEAVRRFIRRYVLLESVAIMLLGIACWFWIGLVLDFGLFRTVAFDWMQELDFVDSTRQGSLWVRAILLIAVLGLLGWLLVSRLVMRLLREFSDPAVAVVLERRFPRELGDRLITAVELSDPKKAQEYGYSGDMLRQTIAEAAERVERLPVAEVFDWGRLRRLWIGVFGLTIGLLVVAVGLSLGVQAARGEVVSPFHALYGLRDVAGIWTERNAFLKSTYWPRSSHLEVVRFQDTTDHPLEMRVGRNEQRPDVVVRSVEWVVPDKEDVSGWRALKMTDLRNFLAPEMVDKIDIPEHWGGWIVDLDDLPGRIPTAAVPSTLQGKTIAELDAETKDTRRTPDVAEAIAALGNWKTWSFDKLHSQIKRHEIQDRLAREHPNALAAMTEIESRLEAIAADPAMGRRLRHLTPPDDVKITFRGAKTQSSGPPTSGGEGKYTFTLADLKESVSFWVRGGDFYTRPLQITLVPPPSLIELNLDKEEPAYLYWRLVGDQMPLKGKKQIFRGQKAPVGGDRTSIDVPLGSNIMLRARVDRPLKESILIRPVSQTGETGGFVPEAVPVIRDKDGKGFSVSFTNVRQTMDFQFVFHDLDNVQGSRKMHIRPIDDQPPDIANLELSTTLRKGKFKEAIQRSLAGGAADGLLITPKANLPVIGTIKDDVELTKLVWAFETQPITIEKSEKGPDRIIMQGSPIVRRTGIIASLFQHGPLGQVQLLAAPWHVGFASQFIAMDLKAKQADPERFAPLASFATQLQRVEETPLNRIDALLETQPKERFRLREHNLKDVESFNVREHLPDLRVTDTGSPKEVFHVLKLSLVAVDNNVETGPSATRSRAPIQFLIVSEGELLAQVGLEEEVLHDRFEKVVAKLKAAQTTLKTQVVTLKTGSPETDYGLTVLRIDEVRKALLDTGAATREIYVDYSRILAELKVNNVRADKISDLTNKVVLPLDRIVSPNFGEFALTDDVVQRLYTNLDEDVSAKKVGKNIASHAKTAVDASEQMDVLIDRMQSILSAIDKGVDFAQIIARAGDLLRDQDGVVTPLRLYEDQKLRELLEDLIAPVPAPKKK